MFQQKENEDCHIILRGGDKGPNYKAEDVAKVCAEIEKSGRIPHVMVDFSHANSSKQFKKQMEVCVRCLSANRRWFKTNLWCDGREPYR